MDLDKDLLSTQMSTYSEVEKGRQMIFLVTAVRIILTFSLQFDFFLVVINVREDTFFFFFLNNSFGEGEEQMYCMFIKSNCRPFWKFLLLKKSISQEFLTLVCDSTINSFF